jgi:hypothetical protein
MPTQKDIDLIQYLLKATSEGKIRWEATATTDQFVAGFRGKFVVTLDKLGSTCYFKMTDTSDRELLSVSSEETWIVTSLFESARRVALSVDAAIDEIIQE